MRLPGAELEHLLFAPIDLLEGRVESKGSLFLLLLRKRERLKGKTIASR